MKIYNNIYSFISDYNKTHPDGPKRILAYFDVETFEVI